MSDINHFRLAAEFKESKIIWNFLCLLSAIGKNKTWNYEIVDIGEIDVNVCNAEWKLYEKRLHRRHL
jgi:hypothetical protein